MDIIELLNVKIKNADYSDEDIISLKREDVARVFRVFEKQAEKDTEPVFKVGQKVRVIANSNHHQFQIDEIVELREKDMDEDGDWQAYHLDGSDWWQVLEKDIEPIN